MFSSVEPLLPVNTALVPGKQVTIVLGSRESPIEGNFIILTNIDTLHISFVAIEIREAVRCEVLMVGRGYKNGLH